MLTVDGVEAFFVAVMGRNAEALSRIIASPGDSHMEGDRFVFSIAGLWSILDPNGDTTLPAFTKLLYASDLNRRLGAHGAAISVYRNSGKVVSNLYVLGPANPASPV